MRHVWAVLILGLLPLTVFGQQPATTAPATTSDSDLAQHIRELEDRVIALEGQVRMLKAAAAQPAQPGAAQPAESTAQAAAVPQPAATAAAPATQAEALAATQGPNLGGAGASAAKALNPDISVIGDFIGAMGGNSQQNTVSPAAHSRVPDARV